MPDTTGTLRLPRRVHVGYGSRAQLPEIVTVHGRRALLVVDPFLVGTPLLQEMLAALSGRGVAARVYAEIVPELPIDTLDTAATQARDHQADVIVAIGGGSTLDAAKLVALLLSHEGPLPRYYGENLVPGPVVPVIALPTTAGTGSEVTPIAVVTDPGRELKVGISSPFLIPEAALVDPELTLGAPAAVTAFSGIDALVHAIESYTGRALDPVWPATTPVFTGRNVLAEPAALRAAALLGPWLPVAVDDPGDRPARARVAEGALLAGIAFGSTGTHLCHAVQYAIGAMTKTPHGLGTGLMLPYVIDTIRHVPDVAVRLADIGAALEPSATPATAQRTLDRVVEINRAIGVPATLAEIGIGRDRLPQVADLTLASARLLAIAPVEPTRELLLDLLDRAHAGTLTHGSIA